MRGTTIRFVVLSFVISFMSAPSGFASAPPQNLTIYTEEHPPYNFLHDGKVVGINADILRAICKATNLQCKFVMLPWNRAYKNTLEDPRSGLISTSRTPQREALFLWVGPLVSSETWFYKLSKRHDVIVNTSQDLLKYSVGVPRHDAYESILTNLGFVKGKNLMNLAYKPEVDDLFFKGKLDLIIASELTLPYQLKPTGYSIADLAAVAELPTPELKGNNLALNKDFSSQQVESLKQALEQMKLTDEISRLKDKYLRLALEPSPNR